jgi:hypothetical protein
MYLLDVIVISAFSLGSVVVYPAQNDGLLIPAG